MYLEDHTRFCDDDWWCLPLSTGLATACPSTIQFRPRTLGTIVFRGHSTEEYPQLKSYFNKNEHLREVQKSITQIMHCTISDFNKVNGFRTYLPDTILTQNFAKQNKLFPST